MSRSQKFYRVDFRLTLSTKSYVGECTVEVDCDLPRISFRNERTLLTSRSRFWSMSLLCLVAFSDNLEIERY